MALTNKIIYQKATYETAYLMISKLEITPVYVDSKKKYNVQVCYSVYADSEKDTLLYGGSDYFGTGIDPDSSLEESAITISNIYSLLKTNFSDWMDC